MSAFNAFSAPYAHAPAPIAIPTSITASVSFLTRPLQTTSCPAHHLAHLQALLRQTLALALARNSPSTITASSSRAPALILSFAPNRLPPPPVLAAARAARVAWAPWMALLAPKEFDLVISPEEVKVAYQGLRPKEEIVWTGKSTPVVLLSRAAAALSEAEDVVSISRYSRGVAQVEDEETKARTTRTSSAGLLQSLASAQARALARCGSFAVSRTSFIGNTRPRTTLSPPTLPQVPSFEAPPATEAMPLINESYPVYQTLPTRVPRFQVQSPSQNIHLRPRTLAQQLLEATHDEDAAELFARLDRATAEGVLTPTPTRTAFSSTIAPQHRPTLSTSKYDESDTDSRPSSRSSTRSTLSTTSSAAPSERSASTAASSVDSVLFILESKTQSLSLTSFPAEQVYESSPAHSSPTGISLSRPRNLPLHQPVQQRSQPFSTPSPITIPASRSRRNDFVSVPANITRAPRSSTPSQPTRAPLPSHQPPVVDSKKAEKTKYLYAGGVSTVLGGGVMLGSTPRGNTEARPAPLSRSHQPSNASKGMWRRAAAAAAVAA